MTAPSRPLPSDNKSARKQNVKFMIAYCRKYIPGFSEMHDRAKASKLIASKVGK